MRYRELSLSIWLLALSAFGVKVPILPEPITHWVDARQKLQWRDFGMSNIQNIGNDRGTT